MLPTKPLFSVVMPTRNRGKMLDSAIRSVLNQTLGDYEIIVSDNFSEDQTPHIARQFEDPRIKYVRSGKPLSMSDSWEFALSHARGEYITFLADDDAYSKIYLERLHKIISDEKADITSCKIATYCGAENYDYGITIPENSLAIPSFNRELIVLDRAQAVCALFTRFGLTAEKTDWNFINFPQLTNCAYHSSIVKAVKGNVSKLFPVIANDYYSAALFVNCCRKFCYFDEPLYLHNSWEGSATSNQEDFFERYPDENDLQYVPLKKLVTLQNYLKNTVLRAKSDWGESYLNLDIEWSNYFISSYHEIIQMQSHNLDVSELIEEFTNAVSELDEASQTAIKKELTAFKINKKYLRCRLKNSALGKLIIKWKPKKIKVLSNYRNITECAAGIDESFLKKYAG